MPGLSSLSMPNSSSDPPSEPRIDPPSERRTQLRGVEAITQALEGGRDVRIVIADRSLTSSGLSVLMGRCEAAGIRVRHANPQEMRRLSPPGLQSGVVAMLGPDPTVELHEVFTLPGVVWLLAGGRYPGNAGYVIRSAEISGAAGVVIDARFDRVGRRDCGRASMRADRYFPVYFAPSRDAVELARAAGRRIIAIEDVGSGAPWQTDLRGDLLIMIGGERDGIAPALLEEADEIIAIPSAGFLPSYNLQAAMGIVMGEHLRQCSLSTSRQ